MKEEGILKIEITMCYYNSVQVKREEVLLFTEDYKLIESYESPMQSGFSYRDWPVILDKQAKTIGTLAHWEFIPFWVKSMEELKMIREGIDPKTGLKKINKKTGKVDKPVWFNARGETLLDSSMFKKAALERRCLVLSSGFYEWRFYKGVNYPYHIGVKDKEQFYMAGIWTPWKDQNTGEWLDTFSIVTTEANQLMAQVHNKKKRMPTILTAEAAERWMNPDISENEITKLATQHTRATLTAQTIRKDFREIDDPMEPFDYPELPALKVA